MKSFRDSRRPASLDDRLQTLPARLRAGLVALRARLLPLYALRRAPRPARRILHRLEKAGYPAFFVGGSVRDLLLGRRPRDWDIATAATPGDVMWLFPHVVDTGSAFGTVTVIEAGLPVEVTTFRREGVYRDRRHPSKVVFTGSLEEDLTRRDFTCNALALSPTGRLVDPLGGRKDLAAGLVRAVGSPEERFREDALRVLRAARLAAELEFDIEGATEEAVKRAAPGLRRIAAERIRQEVELMLLSARPARALELCRRLGILEQFWPELTEGFQLPQNRFHAYPVWEHLLLTVAGVPPVLHLRLAALLHDVAKPRTLSVDAAGERHFYGHEVVGADMTREMLSRLRFPNELVERVAHLVRHHMELHAYEGMTDAGIRRMLSRVGKENIGDLIRLRVADRAASGRRQGALAAGTWWILRRVKAILEEDAVLKVTDLAVDGHDLMARTGVRPGPIVGWLLAQLLEEVLADPRRNRREYLLDRAEELVRQAPEEFRR